MTDDRTLIPGVDDIDSGANSDTGGRNRKILLFVLAILIVVILAMVVWILNFRSNQQDNADGLFETTESTEVEVSPSYYAGDDQEPTSTTIAPPADDRFVDPEVLASTVDPACPTLQSAWSNQGDDMDCEAYFEVVRALSEQQREQGTLPEQTTIEIEYDGQPLTMECQEVSPNYDCRSESGIQIMVGNLDGSGQRNR